MKLAHKKTSAYTYLFRIFYRSILLPLLVVSFFTFGIIKISPVFSEDCGNDIDCIQRQIDDLERQKKQSEDATKPLEQSAQKLTAQLKSIQSSINAAKQKAALLSTSIDQRENSLAYQYTVFSQRVNESYRRMLESSPLLILFSASSAQDLTRELEYRQTVESQDQDIIHNIGKELLTLEQDKKKLEDDQVRLKKLQVQLDVQVAFFQKEISGAKKYQQELVSKISQLSARQKEILAEKTATAQTTVGDVPLSDDPASRPTYSPGFSPAFALFSFGAPHFKGMSQYGAYGRAQAGQDVETILHAYYGGLEIKKDFDSSTQIHVKGCSLPKSSGNCGTFIDETIDIETYVKRIYEIPSSWGDNNGMEAFKAQAVAARSYALARGGEICPSEDCQVYKSSNKGGKWDEAVNATKGWVLWANGKAFSAWYSSTSGGYQQSYESNGYSTPGFWDTTSDWSRWAEGSYEAKAGSPWFYKGWYKSRSGDSCGRSHPWLTSSEMADILNAFVVRTKGGGSDVERVSPLGGCWGGNPFSIEEMKNKANELGGGYSSVSSAKVEHGSNGYTSTVIFDTDKGEVRISGSEFKNIFNLRAPGRISIKGNLFSIEKK